MAKEKKQKKTRFVQVKLMENIKWIACHDTLVCAGAKQIQKWCVREGDEKGPLVAVMLTEDVAKIIAAAPQALLSVMRYQSYFDTMPKGELGRITSDIGLLNDAGIFGQRALRTLMGGGK